MDKYYVVGLKDNEIAQGALSKIADTVRNDFFKTAKVAAENRKGTPNWMHIKFQDLMMSGIPEEYSGYFTVLYVNAKAKSILDENNITLNVLGETSELPENIGNFISMPHYE